MASMRDVEIKKELRPCLVRGNGKQKKALFHTWEQNSQIISPSVMVGGHNGGVVSFIMGVVESEAGEVIRVHPSQIQFVDNKIQEYAFPDIQEDISNE